ncbi:hypothetical protein D3C72_2535790 [compost metagenome]
MVDPDCQSRKRGTQHDLVHVDAMDKQRESVRIGHGVLGAAPVVDAVVDQHSGELNTGVP